MTRLSPEQFFDKIRKHAETVQEKYHIPASIVMAQAALETEYGNKVKGNNYFGIKASKHDKAENIQHMSTHEYYGGRYQSIVDSFRRYAGLADSTEHYGRFIAGNDRYKHVVHASNAHAAADELQKAGYATDPKYAQKLKSIIDKYKLTKYDDKTKFDNTQFHGYETDDDVAKTNDVLLQKQKENPSVWEDFLKGVFSLLAGIVEAIAGLFSGSKSSGAAIASAQDSKANLNQNDVVVPSVPNNRTQSGAAVTTS